MSQFIFIYNLYKILTFFHTIHLFYITCTCFIFIEICLVLTFSYQICSAKSMWIAALDMCFRKNKNLTSANQERHRVYAEIRPQVVTYLYLNVVSCGLEGPVTIWDNFQLGKCILQRGKLVDEQGFCFRCKWTLCREHNPGKDVSCTPMFWFVMQKCVPCIKNC